LSYESGEPVTAKDLAGIGSSTDPFYRAVNEIYAADKLDPEKAKQLAAAIKPTDWLHKLVAAHALEKGGMQQARKELGTQGGPWRKLLLLFGGFAALVVGLGLAFAYIAARAGGLLQPLGIPLGNLTLPDADRLAVRAAQAFLGFLGVSTALGLLLKGSTLKDYAEVPIYLLIAALLVLLTTIPISGKWISLRSMGITTENLGKNIGWGVAAALVNLPVLLIVQMISSKAFAGLPQAEHPVTVELSTTTSPLVLVQVALAAAVFAPFIEEYIMRGALFPAITSALKSPFLGGLISSCIFAMIHPTGIPAWPALAAIGGMSCLLSYQTKSLVPSMVMHGVHNFGTLVFTVLLLH
jgi:membrane protease YdiL (CAAX protease family)